MSRHVLDMCLTERYGARTRALRQTPCAHSLCPLPHAYAAILVRHLAVREAQVRLEEAHTTQAKAMLSAARAAGVLPATAPAPAAASGVASPASATSALRVASVESTASASGARAGREAGKTAPATAAVAQGAATVDAAVALAEEETVCAEPPLLTRARKLAGISAAEAHLSACVVRTRAAERSRERTWKGAVKF